MYSLILTGSAAHGVTIIVIPLKVTYYRSCMNVGPHVKLQKCCTLELFVSSFV